MIKNNFIYIIIKGENEFFLFSYAREVGVSLAFPRVLCIIGNRLKNKERLKYEKTGCKKRRRLHGLPGMR